MFRCLKICGVPAVLGRTASDRAERRISTSEAVHYLEVSKLGFGRGGCRTAVLYVCGVLCVSKFWLCVGTQREASYICGDVSRLDNIEAIWSVMTKSEQTLM